MLLLLCWHGWLTLQIFGIEEPWQHMTDAEPIVSGRHPLHLYHGFLAARSFQTTHRMVCYDTAFQAGYPLTPVFDSGSRPAALFLTIAGGSYDPAAYKIGLAISCLIVPLFVIMASWGAGLSWSSTCLATAASLLLWCGDPSRRALEAGDIDLMLAALAILAHVGLLLRFHRQPGLLTWLGMFGTGCLGWFAHPMLFLIVLPILLVYYLSIGVRHELSTWHLSLAASEVGALAINSFWLSDWLRHWWLRSPIPSSEGMLLHRTFATIWAAPQWGEHPDRLLGAILLVSALIGVATLNLARQRVAARLLGLGAGGLWLLAILGISWEPLGWIGTAQLMVPALWFAALPAAHAWTQGFRMLAYLTGSRAAGMVVTGALLAGLFYTGRNFIDAWAERCTHVPPLVMGLGPERESLVDALKQATTTDARILWEDIHDKGPTMRWTVLLPVLTGRSFIGGLDPLGTIEHAAIGLVDHQMPGSPLTGRPLAQWSDAELDGYCRRYNIGWIVSRSAESAARFRNWPGAVEMASFSDDQPAVLFTLAKASRSFALKGQATVLHQDSHHITLTDVVPKDGVVDLSMHYQTGMRAAPDWIVIKPEPGDTDPIPFIRLVIDRPVTTVTLTWQGK
jgi:hypothetical protein